MERLVSTISFPRQAVKVLTDSDFNLDSSEPITIKWSDCIIVLFYGNNEESLQLAQIWQIAAQIAAGTLFAAVNLDVHPKIAQAFMRVKNTNSPYRPFAMQGYPFILTYQNGFPVGFYNGERAVQPIVDYSLTLACQPNYFEPQQYASGVSTRYNYEMAGYRYHQPATSSLQFKSNDSFRGYNPADRVVLTGSPAAAQLAQQQQAIDTSQGIQISSTGTDSSASSSTSSSSSSSSSSSTSQRLTGAPVSEFRPADEPIMANEQAERAELSPGEQATTPVLTQIELARLYREQREREKILDERGEAEENGEAEQRAREEAQILAQQQEQEEEESGKKNSAAGITPQQPEQPNETQDLEQALLFKELLGDGKKKETGPRRVQEEEAELTRVEGKDEGQGEGILNEGEQAVEEAGQVGEEAVDEGEKAAEEADQVGEEAVDKAGQVGEEAVDESEQAIGEEERARLEKEAERKRVQEEAERARLEKEAEEERARLEKEAERKRAIAEEEEKSKGEGEKGPGIEDVESEASGDFGELGGVLEAAV